MLNDVLIWIRMVSFTSLFVATVLAFISYHQQPFRWLKSYAFFLTAQATFDLVYTYAIIRRLFLPTSVLAGTVGGVVYLALNALAEVVILFSAPVFVLNATGRPSRRVVRSLLALAVASAAVTVSIAFVENPALWSRISGTAVYAYLTGWFVFGFLRRRKLPVGAWRGPITFFLAGAVLWHGMTAMEPFLISFSFPTTPPTPVSAFTSSLFNLFWATVVIVPVIRQLRSRGVIGADADDPIPDAFVNEYSLTRRECEIVARICRGESTREIADALFISPRTVDTHIQNIHRKCDVSRRVELVTMVQRYA